MGVSGTEERRKFLNLVQLMDAKYLEHDRERAAQARAAAESTPRR